MTTREDHITNIPATIRGMKVFTFAQKWDELQKMQIAVGYDDGGDHYRVEVCYTLRHDVGVQNLKDKMLKSLDKTKVLERRITGAKLHKVSTLYLDDPACWKLVFYIIITK